MSKRFSIYETCVQIYQKQDHELEALEQQMEEVSAFLEQITLCREKLLARALAQMQLIKAEVQAHLRNADINISDAVESEQLTPPTKDMGVDPTPLDTTAMCIADTLPENHAGDNGLREHNLYSSDTKNERISISPSTSLSRDSSSNSHFPGTKSLTSTTWLLPKLLKDSNEPPFAERGLRDFIQVDPPVFINWLPGGSAKSRPTGHRSGRPPRTDYEHSWQKFSCPFMMDVAVAVHHAKFYHGCSDRRDIGVALSDFLMLHACCTSCCYWMVMSIQSKPHSTSFQRGRMCRQRLIFPAAFLCQAFNFVHSSLSSYERGCSTTKARGVN